MKYLHFIAIMALVVTVSCSKNEPTSCFKQSIDGGVVTFSASCSENANAWSWEFGDGTTSIAQNPTHEYGDAGSFAVTLKVTNDKGSTATTTQNITIENVCKYCTCSSGQSNATQQFCGTRQKAEDFCNSCNQQSNSVISCNCN
ncbi:PKD domain-containing protein [bacterium]|nr:PKD domain-containing protein [bacterium]